MLRVEWSLSKEMLENNLGPMYKVKLPQGRGGIYGCFCEWAILGDLGGGQSGCHRGRSILKESGAEGVTEVKAMGREAAE